MIIELVIIKLLQRQQLLSSGAKEEKFFLFGQLKFENFQQILISFLPPFLVSFIILSLFNEPLYPYSCFFNFILRSSLVDADSPLALRHSCVCYYPKDFIDVYLETMNEGDPILSLPQLIGICMDFFEGEEATS